MIKTGTRVAAHCFVIRAPLCYGNVLVNPCPEGWQLVGSSRTCVYIGYGGTQSWSSAKATCEGLGAWLVMKFLWSSQDQCKNLVLGCAGHP